MPVHVLCVVRGASQAHWYSALNPPHVCGRPPQLLGFPNPSTFYASSRPVPVPPQLEDFKARKAAAAAQSRAGPLPASQLAHHANGGVPGLDNGGTSHLTNQSHASPQTDGCPQGSHSTHLNGVVGMPSLSVPPCGPHPMSTHICNVRVLRNKLRWELRSSSRLHQHVAMGLRSDVGVDCP